MKSNLRLFLYVIAFGFAFILWQKWQLVNHVELPEQQLSPNVAQSQLPPSASDAIVDAPSAVAPNAIVDDKNMLSVRTDLFQLQISLQGGTISSAKLNNYPLDKHSELPLELLKSNNPARFVLQSGLASDNSANSADHRQQFSATGENFELGNAQELVVPLFLRNENGVTIEKRYTFYRGRYDFKLEQIVDNQSTSDWRGYPYVQWIFGAPKARSGLGQVYTFTGGVTSSPEDRYNKISLDEMREQKVSITTSDGWIAMIQHYFLGALIPQDGQAMRFYSNVVNSDHILGMSGRYQLVSAGNSYTFNTKAYIGPKIQKDLQAVAPALDKTVDYGFLFMIAQPMFQVLNFIHGLLGNWGWAIIFMTLIIKMIFFVPSAWAYKSMAKMRRLQPEMTRMRERYGDDRQAMSQAMMALYREEKVNPASGCLPMLLQIPFFIAFYWVLVESVELRQAEWIAWIDDLSVMDPYYILPIINAALMFLQQKLNPPPPDPLQAKIMMMMPLVFGFMFLWFPSGLVLYWTVSNAFSIVQQSIMNKRYGEPKQPSNRK